MLSKPFEKSARIWVVLGFPRQLNTVASDSCGNSPEQKAASRLQGRVGGRCRF